MKEVKFLHDNRNKWKTFDEMATSSKNVDPDNLADLFLDTMDDLSYSRTYYPGSQTTQYLNQLSSKIHRLIYKNKKEEAGRIIKFWKYELPALMWSVKKYLLISLLIFASGVSIGFVSSANDIGYVRMILGDYYVNMTIENIEKGDPLAVYKDKDETNMFLAITLNNVLVSFKAFALGLLLTLGAVYVIFTNGVMVGSFFYLFFHYGLLSESMKVIWLHGTLEIPSLVIAGAAGILIGSSFLFPGTYRRLDSFKIGAKKGLKMAVGLVPVFIMAGFIESFITRYTEMPLILSLLIILSSLSFIIGYFLIYPYILHKKELHHG